MAANADTAPRPRYASRIRASASYSNRPAPSAMKARATFWPSAETATAFRSRSISAGEFFGLLAGAEFRARPGFGGGVAIGQKQDLAHLGLERADSRHRRQAFGKKDQISARRIHAGQIEEGRALPVADRRAMGHLIL